VVLENPRNLKSQRNPEKTGDPKDIISISQNHEYID
jgi:hypothetical protein